MKRASLACAVLLAACWADFPESRFTVDRGSRPEQRDTGSTPDRAQSEGPAADRPSQDLSRDRAPVDRTASDQPPPDQPRPPEVTISCTPGEFVACASSDKELHKCNATGNGVIVVICGPSNKCSTSLKRCTECAPATTICSGNGVATCSADGLYGPPVSCPLGCKAGQCCLDVDKDTISDCDAPPDCNDNNADVFPGQTKYFDAPIAGGTSFDYNCNGSVEKEPGGPVNCQHQGSYCDGDGWQGAGPACGQSGNWVQCVKNGGTCDQVVQPKKQRCR